jgi:hypothetical protein
VETGWSLKLALTADLKSEEKVEWMKSKGGLTDVRRKMTFIAKSRKVKIFIVSVSDR